MKQNEFYEADGCTYFIPVTINETYADSVAVTVDNYMQGYKLVVKNAYRFPKANEPQKVVVPKFVAEWLDEMKNVRLVDVISCSPSEIKKWLYGEELRGEESENEKTFIRAWLDGYTVEKEKLYTVEIPNPNLNAHVVLQKTGEGIVLVTVGNARWRGWESSKLTESEIKQDFEWAWQWAKPVEEK